MIRGFDLSVLPEVHEVGHTFCGIDWDQPPRIINEYEIILPYEGEIIFKIGNTEYHLSPGTYILIPPGVVHHGNLIERKKCRYYYVHFTTPKEVEELDTNEINTRFNTLKESFEKEENKYYHRLHKTFNHCAFLFGSLDLGNHQYEIYSLFEKSLFERNNYSINSKLSISLYFSQILQIISRAVFEKLSLDIYIHSKGIMPKVLQKAIQTIDEKYFSHLQLEVLCLGLSISPQYLIRLFNQYIKMTPLQYINSVRITRAKDLMRHSNLSIKEIAYAVGIHDPHYFSFIFKKFEGISPTVYKSGFNANSN